MKPARTALLFPVLLVSITLGSIACGSADPVQTGSTTPATVLSTAAPIAGSEEDATVSTVNPDENDPPAAGQPANDFDLSPNVELADVTAAIVGMTVPEAEQWADDNNMSIRTVRLEGEFLAVTMDMRPNRINVAVADETIVDVDGLG